MAEVRFSTGKMQLEDELSLLLDILKREREAIIVADSKKISEITGEKDRVVRLLSAHCQSRNNPLDQRVDALAQEISRLATQNTVLLRDMQRHYMGMIDLLLRQAGRVTTYGPDGTLDLMSVPVNQARMTL